MEPYIPETLPLDIAWVDHIPLISKANTALARYDGLLEGIVNPDILLSPLAREEAVLSSRIEGSLATMQEALLFEINPDDPVLYERRSDFQEVLNYRKALCHATNRIGTRPMSLHLIRELHEILLGGVRGHDKEPGAFRDNQNRIGKPGSKPEQAIFLPPSPEQVMPSLDN